MEQVQLLGQFTVIAFFSFFNTGNVGLQVFLIVPGRTIDALQLSVLGITAPVSTGHALQFEHAHHAGVRHVRATTHVDVFFVMVQTNRSLALLNQIVDQLNLVVFVTVNKHAAGFIDRRHLFDDVIIFFDQLLHTFFDGLQIFRRERTLVLNIIIKAVLNHRADGHFGGWIQLLDGVAHEVCKRVTDNFQTFLITAGDQSDVRVVSDQFTGVHQLTVDTAAHGGFCQTGANIFGHLHQGDGVIKFAFGTIRKGNNRHSRSLSVVAPTTGHMSVSVNRK